jgi:hypothetical protein
MPSPVKRSTIEGASEISLSANNDPLPVPVVSQESGVLTLHFGSDYIQSQMVVDEPDFLALAYTRTMMAFEVFMPMPREAALIGLGGGSIAKLRYEMRSKFPRMIRGFAYFVKMVQSSSGTLPLVSMYSLSTVSLKSIRRGSYARRDFTITATRLWPKWA